METFPGESLSLTKFSRANPGSELGNADHLHDNAFLHKQLATQKEKPLQNRALKQLILVLFQDIVFQLFEKAKNTSHIF